MSMRRSLITAVAVAAGACLLGAAAAQATTTTTWYTIDVRQPTAATPDLFLGVHARFDDSPIELQPYTSETPPIPGQYTSWADIQWTPVIPDYPATPDVTSSGPITDVLSVIYAAFTCRQTAGTGVNPSGGCGIHGGASNSPPPPLKFVNRGSGRCLSVYNWTRPGDGTTLVASRCRRNQARQTWALNYPFSIANSAGSYADFSQKRSQNPGVRFCADVGQGNAHDHRRSVGTRLQMWKCTTTSLHANQEFRFLQVSQATCEPQYAAQVCGLQESPT